MNPDGLLAHAMPVLLCAAFFALMAPIALGVWR